MDDFATAVDEDEKSIYYDQRIPYSSWKLLKKVSNWEGLISVKYTDKELKVIKFLQEIVANFEKNCCFLASNTGFCC